MKFSKYKVNIPGPYHIKNGIPCQDAYCIRETPDGVIVAAVADGLGSETHSDKGAKIASSFAVTFCKQNYKSEMTEHEVISLLRRAYTKAYALVEKTAINEGNDVDQYDCTLCTVIYDGKTLYYGQSGDSGLIVGSNDGGYYKITEQQRDEDNNVYPLCFGPEYWDFGKVNVNVVSVMLMTDGVWDQACPPILKNEQQQINIGFVDMFLNHFGLTDTEVRNLEREATRYMRNFSQKRLDDDKTIVVIINSDAKPSRREESYYAAPDWDELAQERDKRMNEASHKSDESDDETTFNTTKSKDKTELHIPVDFSVVGKAIHTLAGKMDELLVQQSKPKVKEVKKLSPKTIHIDIKV